MLSAGMDITKLKNHCVKEHYHECVMGYVITLITLGLQLGNVLPLGSQLNGQLWYTMKACTVHLIHVHYSLNPSFVILPRPEADCPV